MNANETKLARELLRALLQHPETVVVMDEATCDVRLVYKDELEHARG